VGGNKSARYDRVRRFLATLLRALRSGNLFSKRDTAVLDAPEPDRASTGTRSAGFKRGAPVTEMPLRRDYAYADDFADDDADGLDADGELARRSQRPALRLNFHGGLLPKTLWGRIAASLGLFLLAGAGVAAAMWVRGFLLHNGHFVVQGSDSIQIAGNSHLTRAQLLSVFGEDVDRNIFTFPLDQRRQELEGLPWVEHATVMRLLPNRVRVAIVERTPVAFVRQGAQIGLVDASGALFDLPEPGVDDGNGTTAARDTEHYSFPVVSGISAGDPHSVRTARMKIYLGFIAALDASGEGISHRLSEVDLSNPEDVKAIIPSSAPDAGPAGGDILVHFGEEKFLERYRQYQEHLAEWRTQYPRLASVDMRYERQVVLEMQPGAAAPASPTARVAGAVKAKPEASKAASAPAGHNAPVKAKGPAAAGGDPHAKTAGHASAPGTVPVGAPQ